LNIRIYNIFLCFFLYLTNAGVGGKEQFVGVFDGPKASSTTDPVWPKIQIPIYYLVSNGDLDRQLVLQVYDYEAMGDHRFLGETNFTVRELLNRAKEANPDTRRFLLHNQSSTPKPNGTITSSTRPSITLY
jgi:Ca2+-dependent lipid-binding protein